MQAKSSSNATFVIAYVLLFIYLALLFISIVCIRTEKFATSVAEMAASLVPCYDSATIFASSVDAYNAGQMFKYAPIVNNAGTCFYYTTEDGTCLPGISGLSILSSQRFNHGLSAGNMRACIYTPSTNTSLFSPSSLSPVSSLPSL